MNKDQEIKKRLSKLVASKVGLSEKAMKQWKELSHRDSSRELAANKRDKDHSLTVKELINWLKDNSAADILRRDEWQKKCRENFDAASDALCALAEKGTWLPEHWCDALQIWSEDKILQQSWSKLAPVLVKLPEDVLQESSYAVSQWLQVNAKVFKEHEEHFFSLVDKIFDLEKNNVLHSNQIIEFELEDDMGGGDDPVMRAINHPVGYATEALILWWLRQPPSEREGLPRELSTTFSKLCKTKFKKYGHGRVFLAAYANQLFSVDPEWTIANLLPLFSWEQLPDEARLAWSGFLWIPHVNSSLMKVLKYDFLDTANYYQDLGQYGIQFADFLTVAALNPDDIFDNTELEQATDMLPPEGLGKAAITLVRVLEDSEEQSEDCWTNQIAPYLREIWPKDRNKITPGISQSLSRLCIAAKEKFPEAFLLLRPWIKRLKDVLYLVQALHESKLCSIYPIESLRFLDLIISDNDPWISDDDLKGCLDVIKEKIPRLEDSPQYVRLNTLVRHRG